MFKKLNLHLFISIFLCLIQITGLNAQDIDTLKSYWLDQVEIKAKRLNIGEFSNRISKDNLENILGKSGFSLIRKGVFFAQDIYADGLKKGDINVVIDGERYHSACPNRMDSPLTRVNPLDLESVELAKNSTSLQSGLGGLVQFNRSNPSEKPLVKIELSSLVGAQKGIDLASIMDYSSHRISLRYSKGSPYVDGDKKSFIDNYNYKENFDFMLAEGSIRGKYNKFSYGISYSYTEDVSFPYLLMDERKNNVYSAHLRYDNHKIYLNFTNHIMDNDLRINTTLMRTSVTNLTIGAVGDFYELVYRNWNADNFFKNPNMFLENDLIPDVNTYLANLFHSLEWNEFLFHGRVGFSYQSVGQSSRQFFYKQLYPDPKMERFFPLYGLSISYQNAIAGELGFGLMAELNTQSPETESLFIAVQKPGIKPAWIGNPNLDQPIKSGLRGVVAYKQLTFEAHFAKIWNYNNLVQKSDNEKQFLTFQNINALIAGTNINYTHPNIEIAFSYVWAKNNSFNIPLSEIPPINIITKLISPRFSNLVIYAKHKYNDAQSRIDNLLNESSSESWHRIDLGIDYSWTNFNISFDVENIMDSRYYQHLSYLRDPFSAKKRIFEPGRIFRITFKTTQLL